MTFTFRVPVPPPKNNLRGTHGKRRYLTKEYEAWLTEAPVLLAIAMRAAGLKEPDTDTWWIVLGELRLPIGCAGDSQNYEEALFDLLEGTQTDPVTRRTIKPGLFWDDDGRVKRHSFELVEYVDGPGSLTVSLTPTDPPPNWKPRKKRKTIAKQMAIRQTRLF